MPTRPSAATMSTSDFEYTVPTAKSRCLKAANSATVARIWATAAIAIVGQNRTGTAGASRPSTTNNATLRTTASGAP